MSTVQIGAATTAILTLVAVGPFVFALSARVRAFCVHVTMTPKPLVVVRLLWLTTAGVSGVVLADIVLSVSDGTAGATLSAVGLLCSSYYMMIALVGLVAALETIRHHPVLVESAGLSGRLKQMKGLYPEWRYIVTVEYEVADHLIVGGGALFVHSVALGGVPGVLVTTALWVAVVLVSLLVPVYRGLLGRDLIEHRADTALVTELVQVATGDQRPSAVDCAVGQYENEPGGVATGDTQSGWATRTRNKITRLAAVSSALGWRLFPTHESLSMPIIVATAVLLPLFFVLTLVFSVLFAPFGLGQQVAAGVAGTAVLVGFWVVIISLYLFPLSEGSD